MTTNVNATSIGDNDDSAPATSARRIRKGATVATALCLTLGTAIVVSQANGAKPASADQQSMTSVLSATGFTDSVGVNVHMSYGNTSYKDPARVLSLLQGLGVRHIRDNIPANRADQVKDFTNFGTAGIRSSLIVSGNGTSSTVDPSKLAELRQLAPYLDSIEPTNEVDCSSDPSWAADMHAYANALANAINSDPTLSSVPLLGPSFCRPDSVAQYGSLQGSASIANDHDYPYGQAPELSLESRQPAWLSTQGQSMPMEITETGYHNALNNGSAGQPAVTDAVAADYDLRSLLDAKRIGVKRTYLYELLDEKPDSGLTDPEQHFGLVNYDGTVKPAYTAIHNLLTDLNGGDPFAAASSAAQAQVPAVSIRGGGALLRSMPIADNIGGGQTIAMWLATPLVNNTNRAGTLLPDRTRTVQLNVGSTQAATSRQPSRGNDTSDLGTGQSFDVPVNGAVTLVHLAPASTSQAGTNSAVVNDGDDTAAACQSAPGYSDTAQQLGATVADDLTTHDAWAGSPSAVASIPGADVPGTQITDSSQTLHLSVPNPGSAWTVTAWERTDPGSAAYSTFLHLTGARGALLRTYNLSDDIPSHVQLSGYGLPASGQNYGGEMFANAIPGTWHMVSLSNDGTTATMSVDGVVTGSVASSSAAVTGIDLGNVSGTFRGALGGLRVFPRALSSDELLELATASNMTCTSSVAPTNGTGSTSPAPTTRPATTGPSTTAPTPPAPSSTPTTPSATPTGTTPTTKAPTSTTPTTKAPTSTAPTTTTPTTKAPTTKAPVTRDATQVGITAPDAVTVGQRIKVWGRTRTSRGQLGNTPVALYIKYSPTGAPTRLASRTTDSSGVTSYTFTATQTVYLFWMYAGSSTQLPANSDAALTLVTARTKANTKSTTAHEKSKAVHRKSRSTHRKHKSTRTKRKTLHAKRK